MQGFAELAGEDGIVLLDLAAPLPASSFPGVHASALAAAAAYLLAGRHGQQQPTAPPAATVDVLQLLMATAAVGLVPRPGTGAVFSRYSRS